MFFLFFFCLFFNSNVFIFLSFFYGKNPSFKIVITGQAGIGCRPRFTFWLTFFSEWYVTFILQWKNPSIRHFSFPKIKMAAKYAEIGN